MPLWDDLTAAKAKVEIIAGELAAARSEVGRLEAMVAPGGPDVSEFQGDVDWTKVASVSSVAFCRISDGDRRDARMNRARAEAVRAAGLMLGTYHFARVAAPGNSERSGKTEAGMAVYFADAAGALRPGDLPLAYDLETANGQPMPKVAAHALDFIKAYRYLTGDYPLIYGPPAFLRDVGAAMDTEGRGILARCPLWVAHWGVAAPTVPAPWSRWAFWQHTDARVIPGVSTPVDFNHFAGSKTDLADLRIVR